MRHARNRRDYWGDSPREPTEEQLGPQVRAGLAAIRPLKKRFCGEPIPLCLLDRVIERVDCARSRKLGRNT